MSTDLHHMLTQEKIILFKEFSGKTRIESRPVRFVFGGQFSPTTLSTRMTKPAGHWTGRNDADTQDATQQACLELLEKGMNPVEHQADVRRRTTWRLNDEFGRRSRQGRLSSRSARCLQPSHYRYRSTSAHDASAVQDDRCEDPVTRLLRSELVALVKNAISRLPPDTARLLRRRFIEQVSIKAIAAEMHLPVTTIWTRVSAAMRKLRHMPQIRALVD